MRALDWGDGQGPNLLVDDGGDMTLLVLEGAEWEVKYEQTKELPDPSRYTSDDEKALYSLLRKVIPQYPNRFRQMSTQIRGVSEETTTGVMRLYQL